MSSFLFAYSSHKFLFHIYHTDTYTCPQTYTRIYHTCICIYKYKYACICAYIYTNPLRSFSIVYMHLEINTWVYITSRRFNPLQN